VDFLIESASLGVLPARYFILEVSAELRQRQQALLEALVPTFVERVEWLDELPSAFEGLVLANEVIDALPVARFRRSDDQVEELTVVVAEGRFGWGMRDAPQSLIDAVLAVEHALGHRLHDGFVSEVNLRIAPWIASLGAALRRGAMVFIDYGMTRAEYYAPERAGGTLLCHYRHRAHDDPFVWPGLQDITAQVDFSAVAEAGVAVGLDLAGYTTQAHLLVGCGIDELLTEPIADERGRWIRSQQAQRLMLPGEMGERFKAIGFTRGLDLPLRAFSVRDFSDRL
jgi:SAM-dependent MidA family methyltransferase